MTKKVDKLPPPKKNIVQKVLYSTGRVVARAGKIKKNIPLEKVSTVSKKAWQTTKTSSVKIGAEIKGGAVDIAKSFYTGFQSLTKEQVPTQKRVEGIFEGTVEESSDDESGIISGADRISNMETEEDYTALGNTDIDSEIDKIDKEIKSIKIN